MSKIDKFIKIESTSCPRLSRLKERAVTSKRHQVSFKGDEMF